MLRKSWVLGAALVLGLGIPAHAQRVSTTGFVDRIDAANGVLTLRSQRQLMINPDAELTINGRPGMLGDIQYNAEVSVLSWRDRGGVLHADVVRVTQTEVSPRVARREPALAPRSAAVSPGTVITGRVAGIIPTTGTLILRTPTGFRNVSLGTAPIMLNGRAVTLFDLAMGDRVQVQHQYPTGGLAPLPSVAVVLTPQQVAGSRQTFRNSGSNTTPAAPPAPRRGSGATGTLR